MCGAGVDLLLDGGGGANPKDVLPTRIAKKTRDGFRVRYS